MGFLHRGQSLTSKNLTQTQSLQMKCPVSQIFPPLTSFMFPQAEHTRFGISWPPATSPAPDTGVHSLASAALQQATVNCPATGEGGLLEPSLPPLRRVYKDRRWPAPSRTRSRLSAGIGLPAPAPVVGPDNLTGSSRVVPQGVPAPDGSSIGAFAGRHLRRVEPRDLVLRDCWRFPARGYPSQRASHYRRSPSRRAPTAARSLLLPSIGQADDSPSPWTSSRGAHQATTAPEPLADALLLVASSHEFLRSTCGRS